MAEASKISDPDLGKNFNNPSQDQDANNDVDNAEAGGASAEDGGEGSIDKKKKTKKAKLKKALTGRDVPGSSSNPASKLTSGMVEQLLEMNPSLKSEVAGLDKDQATEKLKKLDVADMLTGMVRGSKIWGFKLSTMLNVYTVSERKESERHGVLQVLADAASASIWSVIYDLVDGYELRPTR